MRAGADWLRACVGHVFGAAHSNRMKRLVHDGVDVAVRLVPTQHWQIRVAARKRPRRGTCGAHKDQFDALIPVCYGAIAGDHRDVKETTNVGRSLDRCAIGLAQCCMLDVHAIKPQDLEALSASELTRLAAQMLRC